MRLKNSSILAIIAVLFSIYSCDKASDFQDGTQTFPLGWKSVDTFTLTTSNVLDTIGGIHNLGFFPLGNTIDNDFGFVKTGAYLEFQPKLNIQHTIATTDSVVLYMPFLSNSSIGQSNVPVTINVFELSENLDDNILNKKNVYTVNSSPIGTLNSYTYNFTDSIVDGLGKVQPGVKVVLNNSVVARILQDVTYETVDKFQQNFKGIYVTTSGGGNTNGYVLFDVNSNFKIKIYGKDAAGLAVEYDFVAGGSNATLINQYLHDNTSIARTNLATKNKVYLSSLFGQYGEINMQNLSAFVKGKNVFKAELILNSIDTSFLASSNLGLLVYDSSSSSSEVSIPDQFYGKGFNISENDIILSGQPVRQYKYNVGYLINSTNDKSYKLRLYPSDVVIGSQTITKTSNFLPSRAVVAGSNNSLKPKLIIYYTEN